MSLWDKTEYDVLTGTFDGTLSGTTITATGAADLTTVLKVGDIVNTSATGAADNIIVLDVDATTITVAPLAAALTAATLYRKDVPEYLRGSEDAGSLSIVSTEEASNSTFKAVGLKTPGWTRSVTYTDQNGKVRNKTETLVVFKS